MLTIQMVLVCSMALQQLISVLVARLIGTSVNGPMAAQSVKDCNYVRSSRPSPEAMQRFEEEFV